MNLPPSLRPSRLSPRARYVTGGLVGALMATSLVMLGTVLPYGDRGDKQHVTLTGSEGEAGEVADAPATETTEATDATEASKATVPTPSAAEVPGRVVAVEDRVGKVESRVDKLETTTTTSCSAPKTLYRPGFEGQCVPKYDPAGDPTCESWQSMRARPDGLQNECWPTTPPPTVATTTTTVRPRPVWTTRLEDGQVTVTLTGATFSSPRGVMTITLDDGSKVDIAVKYDNILKAGQTLTWVWQAKSVVQWTTEYHSLSGTITDTTPVVSAPWWDCDQTCQRPPEHVNWVLVNPTVS